VRVLFVGINPGVRSALTGHHFAGFSNRFWKLLFDARLVPEPIAFEDDDRLPAWGYGITNIVARATPGVGDLRPDELRAGARRLLRKVRRYEPEILALVGVTVWRALQEVLDDRAPRHLPVTLGFQDLSMFGPSLARSIPGKTRIFVLPNPSGRNANFSYAEMRASFTQLAQALPAPS